MESKLLFIYFYWQESLCVCQAGETLLPNESPGQFIMLLYIGPIAGPA